MFQNVLYFILALIIPLEITSYLDGVQVSPTNIVKDLGVTIDSLLKFHEHTNLTVSNVLGLICETFQCREQDMVTRLFKSLIRLILEYGNLLWGPFYSTDQQAIEGVQQRATKLITSIRHLSYL